MTRTSPGKYLSLALLALILVPALASAGEHKASIDISLPLQLLTRLGGTITLDCDNDVDADTRAMIQTLRRTNRYEKRDGDDQLVAWRFGDRFRMKAKDGEGDGTFTLEMPWAAAECLFGGTSGKRQIKLEALERTGGFELRMSGDDGQISVAVD